MKKMRINFLLCFFVILGCKVLADIGTCYSIRVQAAESSEVIRSGDWSYYLDENDKAIIVGYSGDDEEIIIDQIDGKDVVAISDRVFAWKNMEKLTLPEGLERIGEETFCECSSLKEVDLPATLTSIGNRAFYGDYSLSRVELPAGLQFIGEDSFGSCVNLFHIGLEEENPFLHYFYLM